jgi:hypothetical protein
MKRFLLAFLLALAAPAFGAQQVINLGTGANTGDGDSLRTAMGKVTNNFAELYSAQTAAGVIQRDGEMLTYDAILDAFGALQNGDVLTIRPGTYSVQAPYYTTDDADLSSVSGIVLRNLTNVTVQGTGWDTVIEALNYGNLITIENCNGVTIRDIKLVGSTNDIGTKTIVGMVNHKLTNGMTRAESVYFLNAPDQGWTHCFEQYERRSTEWQIVNCVFENVGQTNHPASNLVVDGACVSGRPDKLIFTGNRTKGLIALAVIEMDGGGDSDPAAYTFGDAIITGNILEGLYQFGIDIAGYENNVVDGMQIHDNYFAFHPTSNVSGTASHVLMIGAQNISIQNNRFTGAIENVGGFRPYGVLFWEVYGDHPNSTNIVIKGNSFEGMAFGIGVSTGVGIADTISGVTVQDNTFIDQGESSIYFAGSNWTIDGNTFLGCGRAPTPTYYMAILAADLAYARLTNAVIVDNVLNDIADTPTTLVFVYYESSVNPPMPITVRDNEAIRQGVAPTYVFPTGTSYATFPNRTFVSPGDSSEPSIVPVNDQNSGLYFYNGATVFVEDAIGIASIDDRGILIDDTGFFGWNQPDWSQADVRLYRGGPGTLEQRWGTVPNTNRIFTSYTDTTNYEGFAVETRVGSVDLKGITAGTGWDDITLNLIPAGAGTVTVPTASSGTSNTVAASTAFVKIAVAAGGGGGGSFDGNMAGGDLTNVGAIYMSNPNYTNEWSGLRVTNLFVAGLANTNLGVDANGKIIAVAGGTGGVSSWNDLTDIPAGFADDVDDVGSTNLTDSGTTVTVAGGLTLNGDLTVNGTNNAVWSFADADSTDPEKVDIGAPSNITNSYAMELAGDTNGTPGYLFATLSGTNRLGKPRLQLTFATPTSSGVTAADIDTSAELRSIVGDESGTGALLFAGGALGAATATTPAENDSSTAVATTAYVQTELSGLGGGGSTNITDNGTNILVRGAANMHSAYFTNGFSIPSAATGDMLYFNGTSFTRIAAPTRLGSKLTWGPSGLQWSSPVNHISLYDEFTEVNSNGGLGWVAGTAGGVVAWNDYQNIRASGVALVSGSSAGNYAEIYTGAERKDYRVTGGPIYYEWQVRTPSGVSDGTDPYQIFIGMRSPIVDITNCAAGIYFTYNHNINSGAWTAVTVTNSVKTLSTASSPAVAASTTYKLGCSISITDGAIFYINGTAFATNAASTFDTSDTGYYALNVHFYKWGGTVNRGLTCDYTTWDQWLDSPR